jgi:hypothetical protein
MNVQNIQLTRLGIINFVYPFDPILLHNICVYIKRYFFIFMHILWRRIGSKGYIYKINDAHD